MSDYRVKYLKFTESRPLLISVVATSILCTISVIGLLLENGQRCRPDMQLWLIVVVIRSAVRLLCRLFVAYTTLREGNVVDQIRTGSKFVDILDVFGIVWFAVGNLLVFNNFGCINISPIVFFSGLSYICGSYINFFMASVLRLTFTCIPPTHIDDIAYLRLTADADRDATMVHLRTTIGVGLGTANNSAAYSSELSPERTQYWINWLESYGCLAVCYHPSMNLKEKELLHDELQTNNKDNSKYTALNQIEEGEGTDIELGIVNNSNNQCENTYDQVGSSIDDDQLDASAVCDCNSASEEKNNVNSVSSKNNTANIGMDFCSICLNPFECLPDECTNNSTSLNREENNHIIVRYPCRGHHYFHAHCLHSWLQVSSARYLNQLRNRPGVLQASLEQQQEAAARQVTCPCCREQPPPL